MNNTRLASQLILAEGRRVFAYRDPLGFWTAGVGHLLPSGHDWSGSYFLDAQVDAWLQADIHTAVISANALLEWPCLDTAARQNAVVELVFNMGLAHWKGFAQTRMAITHKNWTAAHDGLLDSKWAVQVGKVRSTRLANYLLSGEFD